MDQYIIQSMARVGYGVSDAREIAKIVEGLSSNDDEETYECDNCQTKSKVYRMFDIDGTNLIETLVCLNCRDGEPSTLTE